MRNEISKEQQGRKTTLIGFYTNIVLSILKIVAGIIGKSGAMLADGVHSISDFFTDVVVILGLKLSEKPEDDCHNYGHGKYEALATAIISIFLGIVGFEILKAGVVNIIAVIRGSILPRPGFIALIVAIISIIVKEILYQYTVKIGKHIKSPSIIANAWHHRSDALSSIGTTVGIGGSILLGSKWTILDPIASVIVSIFIFKVAFDILKPAINELIETSLSHKEIDRIRSIMQQNPSVKSYHKLRTRKIGSKVVLEMHIVVDNSLDIITAHNLTTEIESDIKDIFGDSTIITLHIEPKDAT